MHNNWSFVPRNTHWFPSLRSLFFRLTRGFIATFSHSSIHLLTSNLRPTRSFIPQGRRERVWSIGVLIETNVTHRNIHYPPMHFASYIFASYNSNYFFSKILYLLFQNGRKRLIDEERNSRYPHPDSFKIRHWLVSFISFPLTDPL